MTFYRDSIDWFADELKDYGINMDVVESEGYDDLFSFVHDPEMLDKYCPGKGVYDDIAYMIEENIANGIEFSVQDLNKYIKTSIGNLGYDKFKEIEEDNGYNPIQLPDTEEEFYQKLHSDSIFREDVYRFIWDAVLIDWPYLNIYNYDDGFYYAVERKLY